MEYYVIHLCSLSQPFIPAGIQKPQAKNVQKNEKLVIISVKYTHPS